MYIIISVQEIKPKLIQLQHLPLSSLACLLTVLSVTIRDGSPPLLLGVLSMCDSSNIFASCKKSLSMLFEFLAEVSRKSMSFSCANFRPCSCVISLSIRSLLLPAEKDNLYNSSDQKKTQ